MNHFPQPSLVQKFSILLVAMLTAQPLSAAPPPPAPPATVDFQFRDGDRVVMIGNTLVERAQAYGHLETAIVARLSGIRLTFRNLGWSGDTVRAESRGIFDPPAKGYQRMLDHVARLKPTVLVLGYGSNESFSGDKGIPEFLARYRKLISDLRKRSAPGTRVVILSIPPQQRPGLRRLNTAVPVTSKFTRSDLDVPIERNRQIGRYNTALANFALGDGHAHLDLNAPFQKLWDKPRRQFRLLFTVDGRALNSEGYRVATRGVLAQLFPTSTLAVQLKRGQPPQVTGPLATGGATYQKRRLEFSSRFGPFVLQVQGLRRGRYTLRIDGDNFGDHTAEEFAAGIAPQFGEPGDKHAALRRAVIAKNRLYFHRWRPQNTTYLFGFRKREQGNNATEVAEFEKLVAIQEAEIDRLKAKVLHRITIEPGR